MNQIAFVIKDNRIIFENGRPVIEDDSLKRAEGFNIVDTFIKNGIDAETGNKIIAATINFDADEKQFGVRRRLSKALQSVQSSADCSRFSLTIKHLNQIYLRNHVTR